MADDNVTDESDQLNDELNLHSAGETLRHAREQKNLSLEDIAKITRVSQRHLASIESSEFDSLPSRTYVIGFGKSYARALGLSEAAIGNQLREEMAEQGHTSYRTETSGYEPTNPSSIPPKYLAWTAAAIGAVLLVAFLVWRTLFMEPVDITAETASTNTPAAQQSIDTAAQTADGPALSSTGTVVLTATENVWLKIYDEDNNRLFENEMKVGEKYNVPADAKNPQILTGKPDALTVTIDGKVVPPLGAGDRTISDVGISAAALVARGQTSESGAVNNAANTQE